MLVLSVYPVRGLLGVISRSTAPRDSSVLHTSAVQATGTLPAFDHTYQAQPLALPYYATQGIERPPVSYTATGQPCYAAQFTPRPAPSYPRPELSRPLHLLL
ncbi:hypothetical protein CK203_056675 [Vitis vinifera]|uniref:Uncharacterized protein n=1 Tax=Vitis vinifera TaxID=29760 RepID=A0A438GNS3_VITVI|nr:hypothetical protein CK203_095451 [Vitis vinifera]RVW73856.1 hypothetical protein CK203_056675 [Vitis vinifera]